MDFKRLAAFALTIVIASCFYSCGEHDPSILSIDNGTWHITDKISMDTDTDPEPIIPESVTEPESTAKPEAETTAAPELEAVESTLAETTGVPEIVTEETTNIPVPETTIAAATEVPETSAVITTAVIDTTAASDTTATPITTVTQDSSSDKQTDTVYWVKNGEVWHTRKSCPSLSRSKDIQSGTLADAKSAGKSRVCKRCS